jgi:hypothetical protein
MLSRLVIIGNGFDLAHGLKTRYSDFMKYLCTYEAPPKVICDRFICLNSVSPQDHQKHHFYDAISKYIPEQDLWCSFEEALGYLDYEQIQEDNFSWMLDYGDDNWKDSANHDFQYMIYEELAFAENISSYFLDWISYINTNVPPIISLPEVFNQNSLFLNFNYTDTLEKVYNIPLSNILYIHGKALHQDKLILGHHDAKLFQSTFREYPEEDFRLQEAKKIIKDYFRKTYKDTSSIISHHQAFFHSLSGVSEIYIFGHSLSEIDFEYFLEIKKRTLQNAQWYISYHDDQKRVYNLIHRLNIKNSHLFYF